MEAEKSQIRDALRGKRELTEKFIKIMTAIEELEKPRIEEISAREAVSGEIKPSTVISEEISARKPRFRGFFTRP